jgi:FecR protein
MKYASRIAVEPKGYCTRTWVTQVPEREMRLRVEAANSCSSHPCLERRSRRHLRPRSFLDPDSFASPQEIWQRFALEEYPYWQGDASREWRCTVSSRNFFPLSFLAAVAILGMLLLATAPVRAADNTTYSYARIVRLSYVSGEVQIVRTDKSNKWEPAVMNMPVEQGFAIGTNNGRAEIELEHGSTIWLAENSVLQFTELALSNGGRLTRMSLSQGTATFDTSLSAGDLFEVATPSFRAMPANKSEFRVDMFSEGGAVSVFNGKVSVNSAAGTQDVPKGQTFAMNAKSSQNALKRNPSTDEWDHWVNSRSTAQVNGQNQAALYTDAPFTYGMADLAGYGSWNYFPGFGYGWQPWGMSAGWAPFMSGQWMFYPSLGWTWLSSEPWGWVPYHFGGWQYSQAFGWMWMPGGYGTWTAAPVEWVSVGNRIGWVPRAVDTPHPTSTGVPVIVSTKALGKEGKNRVFSASEVSAKIEALAAPPAANGKLAVAGAESSMTARVVVPTAGNLGTLRAGLAANSAAKVDVNALDARVPSQVPNREFTPVNAAMPAGRIPSPPPSRATFTGEGMPGFSAAESMRTTATTSSRSVSMSAPASTSHPSSTASSGKPQ